MEVNLLSRLDLHLLNVRFASAPSERPHTAHACPQPVAVVDAKEQVVADLEDLLQVLRG